MFHNITNIYYLIFKCITLGNTITDGGFLLLRYLNLKAVIKVHVKILL